MSREAEFEWDTGKSERNLRARGFDFEFATGIFDEPWIEEVDTRQDYSEGRLIATGRIENEIFVVVYTWRSGRRRIISARRAKKRERDAYREAYPPSNSET